MISIKDLTFQYSKKQPLFKNLELDLQPGNIYGMLGKNGAGKTTLLKIMSGMLYADSGVCKLDGINTNKRLPKTFQDIFFIPEEFTLPNLSIQKFVETHAAFYPKFSTNQFSAYLHDFNLELNNKLSRLSFGQKKKVIISFGLATNTKYLILDEPSNALDIPSKTLLRKMLAGAITDERSFVVSTHQIRDLENLIDPIIILDNGKIVFHHCCNDITEKLIFKQLADIKSSEVIYSEEKIDGNSCICINSSDSPSKLNLELLFNGVLHHSEALNKALINKN